MSRRGVKLAVVAAAAVALTGAIGTTAWAETVTPGVEQPVFDLGTPDSLLGGQALPNTAEGNYSSAEGRNGSDPRSRAAAAGGSGSGGSASGYGQRVEPYDSGSPFDNADDNGYWRESGDGYSGDDSSSDDSSSDDSSDGSYNG